MKRLWRRILLLSVMFVLAMSAHALASTTYSAKTVEIGSGTKSSWTNQFTLSSQTNISVGINMYNNYTPNFNTLAYQINSRMTYVLQNVNTGKEYYLTDKTMGSVNYEVHTTVPAGTYTFGATYSGIYRFMLYYKVTGESGINIPDKYEIAVGSREMIAITQSNSYGGYIRIDRTNSSDGSIAYVEQFDNDVTPSTITVYGAKKGTCTITVYGVDGTSDSMQVKVVAQGSKTRPTLLYNELDMAGGESVINEVVNGDKNASVTWASNKTSVAKVSSSGKITAVGSGSATITATTAKGGVTYTLACEVDVKQTNPEFIGYITSLNPTKKTVTVSIRNTSGAKMTVYSADARLLTYPDDMAIRQLKLKTGTKATIKNNKTKKLTFTIMGSRVDGTKGDFWVRFKFKLDGKTYFARVLAEKTDAQYIPKNKLTTGNWLDAMD